jgi:6-phosphogluconolactonase
MKQFLSLLFCSLCVFVFGQKQTYLLVGTYTGGKSKGVSVYRFDHRTGQATLIDTTVTPNPSYLAVSPDQSFVYAVNELGNKEGGGKVTAYHFDNKTGHLTELNQTASMGEHPCFISIDKSGKWAVVGNYSSGTVSVLPLQKDGHLQPATTVVQHSGRSVHPRQESPHVHATVLSPDNRFLYVPDLGKDKLMIYAFNQQNGELAPKDTALSTQPGSGPRHFTFHPNGKWAYLVQELSGTVTMFQYKNGSLQPVQTISVLPKSFSGSFTAADIHVSPDGKFLYTSLRDEANQLTYFSVNAATGKLTLKGHQSVLGKTPRNFNFDPTGNFLLAANQNSDEIVVFKVARKTGALNDTGKRINVGNPVCIKWITR